MGEPINDEPIVPQISFGAEDAMQRAVALMHLPNDPRTGAPTLEASRAAGVLVSMARELRLGGHGKAKLGYSGYDAMRPVDYTDEVVGINWRPAPGASGYDVRVRRGEAPVVTPVFNESVSETDEAHTEELSSA